MNDLHGIFFTLFFLLFNSFSLKNFIKYFSTSNLFLRLKPSPDEQQKPPWKRLQSCLSLLFKYILVSLWYLTMYCIFKQFSSIIYVKYTIEYLYIYRRGEKIVFKNFQHKPYGKNLEDLWSLNIPCRTKHFIWKAIRNILPTTLNLKKKGIDHRANDRCMVSNQ